MLRWEVWGGSANGGWASELAFSTAAWRCLCPVLNNVSNQEMQTLSKPPLHEECMLQTPAQKVESPLFPGRRRSLGSINV